jgi:hypothetical protein
MNVSNQLKIFALIALVCTGAGCSVVSLVGNATTSVSDSAIEEATAQSLGLKQGTFKISDRRDQGVETKFNVKTSAGKTYSCYVTSVYTVATGRTVSDAVCTQTSGGAGQGKQQCNALLKAAGKC